MDDEEWELAAENKKRLAEALRTNGIVAEPWQLEGDIWVAGGLAQIMEFCQDWRSEIEDLGLL